MVIHIYIHDMYDGIYTHTVVYTQMYDGINIQWVVYSGIHNHTCTYNGIYTVVVDTYSGYSQLPHIPHHPSPSLWDSRPKEERRCIHTITLTRQRVRSVLLETQILHRNISSVSVLCLEQPIQYYWEKLSFAGCLGGLCDKPCVGMCRDPSASVRV